MKKINQVTATALAKHLGRCARETISEYVARGVIVKLPNGKFDEDDCRNRAFAHLRDKAAGRSGDLVNERALLAKEQRVSAEIKNALSTGQLVHLETFGKVVDDMMVGLRETALGVAGKVADQVTAHTEEDREAVFAIIDNEIRELLAALSTGDIIAPRKSSPPTMPGMS
jgi:phage terminase Nu1 subunit (DNA packaging protein)